MALATVTAVGGGGGAVLVNLTACTNEDVLTAGDAYGGAPPVEDAGVPPPMDAGAEVVSTGSAYGTAVTSDSGPPGDAGPVVVGPDAAYGVATPPDSGPDATEAGPAENDARAHDAQPDGDAGD